jgi:hypothetical protein
VGVRAADEIGVRLVGELDVVGVATLPGNEANIFPSPDALPNAEFHEICLLGRPRAAFVEF